MQALCSSWGEKFDIFHALQTGIKICQAFTEVHDYTLILLLSII